ncbi:hypothetical protein B296_00024913 [Ensete ventricosum]|uniref:Uncharacterized protein n=1 Tax=Ensete ventricosum TaxID=4639 RepID=A0A427A751_ENSVE|nr:hypothetical protein B296_00024913 [Ensete ventricosum]
MRFCRVAMFVVYVEMASHGSSSSPFSISSLSSSIHYVEGLSDTIEAIDPRPEVVGHPSSSSEVEVLSSSSGGVALTDAKVLKALMIMQLCYNNDSTMTVKRLAEVQNRFYVSEEYKLHVPLPGQCSYDTFQDGFGLSIDALEMGL